MAQLSLFDDFDSEKLPDNLIQSFQKLDAELAYHDERYYGIAAPEIADDAYDALRREWAHLLQTYPQLQQFSKKRAVGDDRRKGFRKVRHLQRMLSLSNTYNQSELREFVEKLTPFSGTPEKIPTFVVEPKIDGAACTLIYRKNQFAYGLTRGNGDEGDDVTQNLLTIEELPQHLAGHENLDYIEIRGEVFISRKDFQRVNAQREEEGYEIFANARNLAAGTLKTLNSSIVRERNLQFIAYEIGQSSRIFHSHVEVLEQLKSWGFLTNCYQIAHDFSEIWKAIELYDKERKNFSMDTDGAVLKINSHAWRQELGESSSAPHWAIAYKYQPERALTPVRDIELRVGRTGVITPVAILDPVPLSGSIVQHATLHNADEIQRKDIRIGDFVWIEKAGEIIPAVRQVALEKRPSSAKPFHYPANCPVCGSPLVRIEGEVAYRCMNSECPPQIQRHIEHFVSKAALNIDQLGPKIIEQLLKENHIKSVADLFHLDFETLCQLPHFQEKSAQRLLSNIQNAKKAPIWRLLHGLGIPHIGAQTAKLLTQKWHSIDAIAAANEAELQEIAGIGEIVARSVVQFFRSAKNQELLQELKSAGVCMEEEAPTIHQHEDITGKTFVITGTFSVPRDKIRSWIEAHGGTVSSSLSQHTSALLVGDAPGSKLSKAESLQIPVISRETVENWLSEN